MKRAKQILALLLTLALLLALGGVAEAPVEPEEVPSEAAEALTEEVSGEPAEDVEAPEPEADEPEIPESEAADPEAEEPETGADDSALEVLPVAADDEEQLIKYPEELTMSVGESCTQKVSSAGDKNFTYKSSNTKVVTVSSKGKLTAKAAGTATITVTGKNSQRTAKCKVTVKKAPTKVSLNKSSARVAMDGEPLELTVTIAPYGTEKLVSWTSSNASVASVNEEGEVTGLKEGTATITATAKKKSETGKTLKASCKVTVYDATKPSTLIFSGKAKQTLNLDDTLQIEYTMEPEDTVECELEWASSNKKVATVDEDGEVTPVAEGTATISATTKRKGQDGKKLKDVVIVTVVDPLKPKSIKFDLEDSKPVVAYLGDSLELDYILKPDDAETDVTWKSSNTKIIGIDKETGDFELKKDGTVTITVTTVKKGTSGKKLSASVKVVVVDPEKPVSIELEEKGTVEVDKGDSVTLTPVIFPDTASDAELTWSSSNRRVAKVDKETGEVTGVKKGTATITVKTKNGKKASVKVKVLPVAED